MPSRTFENKLIEAFMLMTYKHYSSTFQVLYDTGNKSKYNKIVPRTSLPETNMQLFFANVFPVLEFLTF